MIGLKKYSPVNSNSNLINNNLNSNNNLFINLFISYLKTTVLIYSYEVLKLKLFKIELISIRQIILKKFFDY